MKFDKVIGKIDPKVVLECEKKMSQVFIHAGLRYDNTAIQIPGFEQFGGDPLLFNLVAPYQHWITDVMPTAATDGKRFYWNPDFILRHSNVGLHLVMAHEAFHAFLMHPDRIMGRIPKLWNIAVDYIVNNMAMDDLKNRNMNAQQMFEKHLGKYITISQYAKVIKDPFNLPDDLKGLFESSFKAGKKNRYGASGGVVLPQPSYEGEVTEEQRKEISRRSKETSCFFADPDIANDFKSPEKIYSYFYQMMPKCPECGRIGMYKMPDKNKNKQQNSGNQQGNQQGNKSGNKQGQSNQGNQPGNQPGNQQGQGNQPGQSCGHGNQGCGHNHNSNSGQGQSGQNGQGQGNSQGQSGSCSNDGSCGTCGGDDYMDIFGFGDTLDEHMATEEEKEKLAQRLASAIEQAKRSAGYVPAGLEAELGELVKPQVRWEDYIRSKIKRTKQGGERSDWTRFRSRPVAWGAMNPKKKSYVVKFACLVDTSGSMADEDIAYGISQLQSLDKNASGWITPADAEIYWDKTVEVKDCKADSLKKMKVIGRGGTAFMSFCSEYKTKLGDADFLVIITDGFLYGDELATAHDPKIPVYWIITSDHADFKPGFGKVFHLRNGDTKAK